MSEITVASTTDTQQAVELAAGLTADDNGQVTRDSLNLAAGNGEEIGPSAESGDGAGEAANQEDSQAEDTGEAGERKSEPEAVIQNGKHGKGEVKKRVDTLARRVYEQQEELDALRERVGPEARPGSDQRDPASTAQADSRPVPANYGSYDAYVEALADWKAGQRLQEQKQTEMAQAEQERVRGVFDTYNEAARSARTKYQDFEEVVGRRDLKIPQAVQVAIIEAGQVGPDIAYYLGKHPDVCHELAKMSPMRAISRIGQIEAQIQVTGDRAQMTGSGAEGRVGTSATVKKAISSAPAPITPVGGSSHKTIAPLGELPYRDYKRLRDQEERAQRR